MTAFSGRPTGKRASLPALWRQWGKHSRIAVAIGTGTVMAVLFTIQLLPDRVSLQVGQIAPREIVAHRSVRYPNDDETNHWRELAARSVEPVYARVADAAPAVEQAVAAFFDRAAGSRVERRGSLAAQAAALRGAAPGVPDRALRAITAMDERRLQRARAAALAAATAAMVAPIRGGTDDLRRAIEQLGSRLGDNGLSEPDRSAVAAVLAPLLQPNRVLDGPRTLEEREQQRASVQTIYQEVKRGEVVIRRGDRVTKDHMLKFVQLGLQHPRVDPLTVISLTALAFGFVALFGFYLYHFHPRLYRDPRRLLLIALITTVALLLFRLGSGALDLRLSGDQTGYAGVMATGVAAMLVAALLNQQVALVVAVLMSLATALLVGDELKFAIIALASSVVGATAVANIRDRAGILRAALVVAATNVAATLILYGATAADAPTPLEQALAWSGLGGLAAVFLFVPAAALLERPFRLTTHLTLLELSDPNTPLLKRLSMEAPGTYAHSIIVGNLAETSAKAIGADALFARVASYYHDVGKVVRPQFFVENQCARNGHTGMSASLSCLVVTAHVRDGVALAERHRLPPAVIDVIKEHHGTCLIKYFYHQAMTTGGEDAAPALEYQFRYEGPRPRTKESGIVMLADAAEASSRTLEKPTPGRIRELVERIVRDRLSDGQLDECELTFKDLEKIIAAITRCLSSLLHARIEYPAADTRALTHHPLRIAGSGLRIEPSRAGQPGVAPAPRDPRPVLDTPDALAGEELVGTAAALADLPDAGANAYPETAGA